MNILLVRPRPHPKTINLQSFMICEPLELEYTAAYLEENHHSVDIIDLIIERKKLKHFLKLKNYQIVAFTGYLPHVNVIKELALQVKNFQPDIKTVVAGVHAEVVPEDFLFPSVDYIISVNGLKTFKELAERLENQLPIEDIQGIWSIGKAMPLPDRTFSYSFPSREKTKKYRKYYNYIYHDQCATIKTSFGCPYRCNFCFCPQITKQQYFQREISDVIAEIKTIKERNIFIVDDNFLLSPKRIQLFCESLKEEGICKEFILFGRADFIVQHPEEIKRLKEVGLTAVFIGLESFKDEDLDDFDKRMTVEGNTQAVRILEEFGVYCYSGLIASLDFEKKDFDRLIQYLNTFKHPAINFQPLTPIPGTPLYEKMKPQICVPRENYEIWDMAHLVIRPTKMSPRKFYYHILRTYFCTSANLKAHHHIFKQYGLKIYLRTLKGAISIACQYLSLIINPRLK